MKLGEGGEAFFVFETTDNIPPSLQTSPIVSPAGSPSDLGADSGLPASLPEPPYLDLSTDGKARDDPATSQDSYVRTLSRAARAQSDLGALHISCGWLVSNTWQEISRLYQSPQMARQMEMLPHRGRLVITSFRRSLSDQLPRSSSPCLERPWALSMTPRLSKPQFQLQPSTLGRKSLHWGNRIQIVLLLCHTMTQ